MKIKSIGFGKLDVELDVPKLTLMSAPNGSGKSTLANAVRIAAIGFIPSVGRTEAATAAYLRGREGSVELVLPSGGVITRKLTAKPKGGYTLSTECSWLDSAANDTEHAAAAIQKFGADATAVAEVLDVRELLKRTGPQRAARIQELIESTSDPKERLVALTRLTLQRLVGVDDDRMPADHTTLRPLVPGFNSDGLEGHTGQYAYVRECWATVKAKVIEDGLAGIGSWITEQKRESRAMIRDSNAARDALVGKLKDVPAPSFEQIAALDGERSRLEREVGAWQERLRAAADSVTVRLKIEKDHDTAQIALSEAEGAQKAASPTRDLLKLKEEALAALTAVISALTQPIKPAPDARLETMAAEQRQLRDDAQKVTRPDLTAALDTKNEKGSIVTHLATALDRYEQSPWREVGGAAHELMHLITEFSLQGNGDLPMSFISLASKLKELAATHLDDTISARLDAAQGEYITADREFNLAKSQSDAASERVIELSAAADRLGAEIAVIRKAEENQYSKELQDHITKSQLLNDERDHLTAEIALLTKDAAEPDVAVKKATARLETITRKVADLIVITGPSPAEVAKVDEEMTIVCAKLNDLVEARAAHGQLAEIIESLAGAGDRMAVLSAIEDSVKRLRAQEVEQQGGPLRAFLDKYLKSAGREERAFVLANKTSCDFGWTTPGGNQVSVASMSGGEYALYVAGLTAAVMLLRDSEVRPLLLEAAEADDLTLLQIMNGISGIADSLSMALVLTPHVPREVVSGWAVG